MILVVGEVAASEEGFIFSSYEKRNDARKKQGNSRTSERNDVKSSNLYKKFAFLGFTFQFAYAVDILKKIISLQYC
jgi:hypothetical protein